ncbi:MAG: MFS transporter [Clostridia bacterium]|nr:MFS transporter [Clostridia bacterium]
MKKRISAALIMLYLFPWGIQFMVSNFLPVYVASLPFANEETVGTVTAIGAVVTVFAQFIWTKIADKVKRKNNVLSLTLLMLAGFSALFFIKGINLVMLYVFVVFFYSCYMVHMPLIDTINAENTAITGHSFSHFRSFASFGYAVMGILFAFIPKDGANSIFSYIIILAFASVVASSLVGSDSQPKPKQEKNSKGVMNKAFVLYLIFTVILYISSSMINTFFPVYYSSAEGIGGSVEMYGVIITVGTFIEWGVMILFGKIKKEINYKYVFMIIVVSVILKSGIIYLFDNKYLVMLTVIFHGIWNGLLWSVSTPYMKKIVPEGTLTSASGMWSIAAYGAGTFTGSFLGGQLATALGIRTIFLIICFMMAILTVLCPFLFPKEHKIIE